MLVTGILLTIVFYGWVSGIIRLKSQDFVWEYEHDREYEDKRMWRERGYLKTPFGLIHGRYTKL